MSATVSVELYTPEDKEAFAAFLTASATADRSRPKDYGFASLGGIERSPDVNWQTRGGEGQTDEGTSTSEVSHSSPETQATAAPQRERGKPAAGGTRRTKAEIAEDEAADAADAARAAAGAETGAAVADRQISTSPEDRKDAEQDAADEAAETAATKAASGKALTHDDARGALGAYVKAYGMPAALEDGPKVLAMMFGDEITKVSAIPDNQEALAKAVAGINEMTAKNPFARTADL